MDFCVQHHQIRGGWVIMEAGITHKVWNFREDGTNRFIFNGKIGAPVVKLIQKT